jgi:hypothetical protein
MSARGRTDILAELGEHAIGYYDDIGECLFCEVDAHGHEDDCPVLEATRKIEALEESESE